MSVNSGLSPMQSALQAAMPPAMHRAAPTLMVMAGGTGGHIYPGLAVATALRQRGWQLVWMGSRSGMEAQIVPRHDIAMAWVQFSGLRGRELEFLQTLLASPDWTKTSPGRGAVVSQLVHCVLQERKPERLAALLALAAQPPKAPWQQLALLDGLAPGTKSKPIKLAAEPPQLATLAASTDAEVKTRAEKIAATFTWPGKPGEAPEIKAPPLTAAQQEFVAKGAAIYNTVCTACHLPQGQGQEGLAPPLAGSEWVSGPESRLIRIVLHGVGGRISVAGKDYTLSMPGLGAALADEPVAQVLSYIRRSFGHEQPIVETATVTKVRAASKDRGAEWTAEELERYE